MDYKDSETPNIISGEESIAEDTITTLDNTNNENLEIELDKKLDKHQKSDQNRSSTSSDNESNENLENSDKDTDKYSKNVTYNQDGIAVYTDPDTNYKYKWCTVKNEWIPLENQSGSIEHPYENEHYRWCSETNQWLPKAASIPSIDETKTETEFYKWNAEKKEWIPKAQVSDVTYSTEDDLYIYKDKDNVVFFWDNEKNAWFPKIDDDFMARYQMNYGFIDNTSNDSNSSKVPIKTSEKIQTLENESEQKEQSTLTGDAGIKRKAQPEPPKWFDISPEQNTKVYVMNLPLDITEEEFIQVMSKCGMIMRDPQTQKFKVKLYAEPDGQLKGDGLCDYIKVESVELALNLLDGYDVRGNKIKIQRAKFQMRGEYNPALKPKRKKKDKEKVQKMKERLFDWRPEKMRGERSKHERVVVLKNLFTPELFDKEVHLIIDYQNDLREECGKCGTVRKVVLYDRHPEGIAQITMSDPEEADLIIQMMNGRYFGKRKLTAETWDGKTKFKIGETETEVEKRLSNWEEFLETDEKGKKITEENKKLESPEQPKDENISEITESES